MSVFLISGSPRKRSNTDHLRRLLQDQIGGEFVKLTDDESFHRSPVVSTELAKGRSWRGCGCGTPIRGTVATLRRDSRAPLITMPSHETRYFHLAQSKP